MVTFCLKNLCEGYFWDWNEPLIFLSHFFLAYSSNRSLYYIVYKISFPHFTYSDHMKSLHQGREALNSDFIREEWKMCRDDGTPQPGHTIIMRQRLAFVFWTLAFCCFSFISNHSLCNLASWQVLGNSNDVSPGHGGPWRESMGLWNRNTPIMRGPLRHNSEE